MRWSIALRFAVGFVCAAASAAAAGFDFSELRSLIETRRIQSVEELLPALPSALRYRYVLMFASRSLQQANPGAPRVILYGPDARLVLTFNGNAAQRGFDVLETLEFAQDKRFRLREIRFPGPGSTERVLFSESNPKSCQACHGDPARPVWDSWPLWPGAYGQRYDAPLSAPERAGLESFLAQQASHARYRHLLGVQRLSDPQTFHASSSMRYAGIEQKPPNAELAALLTGLAVEALVREMRGQPRFVDYQYALLGMTDGECGVVDDFLPSAVRSAAAVGLRRLSNTSAAENRWAANLKEQRLKDPFALTSAVPSATQHVDSISLSSALVPLRFLAEAGLRMHTDRWTLALEKGTYDFTPAPEATPSLRDALLTEVANHDPTVAELSSYATSADGDRYCRYLQRRSTAALSSADLAASTDWSLSDSPHAVRMAEGTAATPHLEQLLRICATCHETDSAPHIPFLQASALQQALLREVSPHGRLLDEIMFRLSSEAADRRMPLGIAISATDRAELQRYFVELGATAP